MDSQAAEGKRAVPLFIPLFSTGPPSHGSGRVSRRHPLRIEASLHERAANQGIISVA
jgi:hypothetical protein